MISLDTETDGLERTCNMFAFSISDEMWNTQVFRLDRTEKERKRGLHVLRRASRNEFGPVAFHNSKFDLYHMEKALGERFAENFVFHDTELMSKILRNDAVSHRLKDLAWELADFPKDDERAIKGFVRSGADYPLVPRSIMNEYQENDAKRTMLLALFFLPRIQRNPGLYESYLQHLRLTVALLRMEERGMRVHRKNCKKLITKLSRELQTIRQDLLHKFGRDINLNAPKEVRFLLYVHAGLQPIKQTKNSGDASTDKNSLLALREKDTTGLVDKIMKHRSYTKGIAMISDYVARADENNVIHPNINSYGAVTGRESSSDPNLQNVSKSTNLLTPFTVAARSCFSPRKGHIALLVDFAGIEMCLLVHYSKEPELIKLLKQGKDVHRPATELFFGKRFLNAEKRGDKTLAKSLRSAAKNANFAIPYGAAASKLGATLGQADKGFALLAMYRKRWPRLATLNRIIADGVRDKGYVVTEFGTILNVPKWKAYVGLNYLIQGTAAELFKRAHISVHKYLEEKTNGECGVVLPIHDELVIEISRKWLPRLPELSRGISLAMTMQFLTVFSVPLRVEMSITHTTWEEKRDYIIPSGS